MAEREPHVLLLTGASGVGKSTVLRAVSRALEGRVTRGFFSDEIRVRGKRVGFGLETVDGKQATLAHEDFRSPHRLGRYGVDVEALDGIVAHALALDPGVEIYLVDEIGKMECFSERFIEATRALLDSAHTVVAVVHRSAGGFVGEVRRRKDAELWEVTAENRARVADRALDWLQRRGAC